MIAKHGAHLTHDFARAQVALCPQQCSQTELAVNRASYLARNTNRRAVPSAGRISCGGIARRAAVSGFAAVALWHPHRLDALTVREPDQIANGSILRNKLLLDFWQSRRHPRVLQAHPELLREGRDLLDGFDPLAVYGIHELPGSIRRLTRILDEGGEFGPVQAKQRSVRHIVESHNPLILNH